VIGQKNHAARSHQPCEPWDELVRRRLATLKDSREVIADPNARFSGAKISTKTPVPGNKARLGETRFEKQSIAIRKTPPREMRWQGEEPNEELRRILNISSSQA